MSIENKLHICQETRRIAADALYEALTHLLKDKTFSEEKLRDSWLECLRTSKEIFPDGWYIPPPHGIGVLIGTTDNESRHNYKSLRPSENWPQKDNLLDHIHPLIYVYASPVDRESGMIGDFGMTIYFGNNPQIKSHLINCLRINQEIIDHAQIGMKLSELTKYAIKLFLQRGLANNITSVTDPTGVNIGHTVPASYEDWGEEEQQILKNAEKNWDAALTMISKKRRFLNILEELEIQKGMAITLEPRLTVLQNPKIPMSSYHTIAIFKENGEKELLTNFEKIFRLVKMDYMLD